MSRFFLFIFMDHFLIWIKNYILLSRNDSCIVTNLIYISLVDIETAWAGLRWLYFVFWFHLTAVNTNQLEQKITIILKGIGSLTT